MNANQKLPVKVKLGFGVGDLGGNLYFTVIAFWLLNYFTDTVGIAAGLAFSISPECTGRFKKANNSLESF